MYNLNSVYPHPLVCVCMCVTYDNYRPAFTVKPLLFAIQCTYKTNPFATFHCTQSLYFCNLYQCLSLSLSVAGFEYHAQSAGLQCAYPPLSMGGGSGTVCRTARIHTSRVGSANHHRIHSGVSNT